MVWLLRAAVLLPFSHSLYSILLVPSSAILPPRYDILLSFGATHENGRTTQSVEQMSKTDKKSIPIALKRHTSLAPPDRPLPPFKKCAKFNLIRSPDSVICLSLPTPLFAVPLALPHSIVETILPSHRLTDCCSNWGCLARLMSEPPLCCHDRRGRSLSQTCMHGNRPIHKRVVIRFPAFSSAADDAPFPLF